MALYVDPEVAAMAPGAVPADWATRAAFRHPLAAAHWERSIAEPDAPEMHQSVLAMYRRLARSIGDVPRLFLSMGAGGGEADDAIVCSLDRSVLQYVPVDLSYELCKLTKHRLEAVCRVLCGIVGDFEGGTRFIRTVLSSVGPGRKMICCTSTIGNLDLGEENFLLNMNQLMERGDTLLLSAGVGAFGRPVDRTLLDSGIEWRSLSGLLSCAIAMVTGEPVDAIEPSLDRRLDIRQGRSDIPGGDAIVLWDRNSGRALLHLRRYDLTAMQSWIEQSFPLKVIEADEVRFTGSQVTMGALMLRRW